MSPARHQPDRTVRIVELLGLPGSGKSTLAAALLSGPQPRPVHPAQVIGTARLPLPRRLDRVARRVPDLFGPRAGRLLRRALWVDRAPDFLTVLHQEFPAFLELVAHAPPPADADPEHVLRWRMWPLETLERHLLLRRADAPGRTVLVEEGVVMRANTVCAGDESLAVPYFTTQPTPDVVVVLDVEPAVALQRLRERPKRTLRRHEGRDDAGVLDDLARTGRLITTAVRVLGERQVPVAVLDARAPVATLRTQVVDLLAGRGSGGAA